MANVPTNTPREVQEHIDKMSSLMSDAPSSNQDELEDTPETVSYDEPNSPFTHMSGAKPRLQTAAPSPRTYKLTLTHDLYKVTFMVQDVSVADYQLAIKVPKSDFRFEPQPNSRFLLECMGKSYSVVYLGGLFDFPSDASWSITFMLEEHLDRNYDNSRTSNS